MTENEKLARLNEYGKDIERMYPGIHGSMIFEYKDGKYMGKTKMILCIDTRPGKRPSPPVDGGY